MNLNQRIYARALELTNVFPLNKGNYASDKDGNNVYWGSPEAACFCTAGYIKRAALDLKESGTFAVEAMVQSMFPRSFDHPPLTLGKWNDAPERTIEDVRDALRKMAA
jgi:hypothetical protein